MQRKYLLLIFQRYCLNISLKIITSGFLSACFVYKDNFYGLCKNAMGNERRHTSFSRFFVHLEKTVAVCLVQSEWNTAGLAVWFGLSPSFSFFSVHVKNFLKVATLEQPYLRFQTEARKFFQHFLLTKTLLAICFRK